MVNRNLLERGRYFSDDSEVEANISLRRESTVMSMKQRQEIFIGNIQVAKG